MSHVNVLRRAAAALVFVAAAPALSACSSGSSYVGDSDYVSPVAVSSAPMPTVPSASGGASARRLPLLPPVPGEQGSTGLPPVNMATLAPAPMGGAGQGGSSSAYAPIR